MMLLRAAMMLFLFDFFIRELLWLLGS